MARKTEVSFELEETLILRKAGKPRSGFCPRCQKDVGFALPEVLSAVARTSEREIFRLIEAGKLHFEEIDRVLVCMNCYANLTAGDPDPTADDRLLNFE